VLKFALSAWYLLSSQQNLSALCPRNDLFAVEAGARKKARGSGLKTGQECMFFGGRPFTCDDFGQDLRDLKATSFEKFTNNFILLTTSEQGSQ